MGLEDKAQQEENPPATVEGVLLEFNHGGDFEHYSVIDMTIRSDDGTLMHPSFLVKQDSLRIYLSGLLCGESGILEEMLWKKVRFIAPQEVVINYSKGPSRTQFAYSRLEVLD